MILHLYRCKYAKRRMAMICKKCGKEVENGALVCPSCGELPVESNAQVDMQGRQEAASARTMGIVAIITGILGIALAGWICGGIGLSKAKRCMFTNDPVLLEQAGKAKKLNVAGIVVSTLVFVIYIVIGVMTAAASLALLGGM